MKIALRLLAFLIVLSFPVACSLLKHPPSRPLILVPPPVEEVRLSNIPIRSLRGIAGIELIYQGKRFRARQAIALEKPGFMRLETLNSLDQPLLILATDGVTFQAMSMTENRFYTGTVVEGLGYFMRLRMSSEESVSLILGEIPLHEDASIRYDSGRGLFQLTFPPSAEWETQTFWIEPETLRVVEITKTRALTGEEIRVSFSQFRKTGSVAFPKEIQIELSGGDNRIGLNFREIEIDLPLPQGLFSLSIPPGVEVVEIEDDMRQSPLPLPGQGQSSP